MVILYHTILHLSIVFFEIGLKNKSLLLLHKSIYVKGGLFVQFLQKIFKNFGGVLSQISMKSKSQFHLKSQISISNLF